MTTCADLQTMLAEAVAQRHKLKLGKGVAQFAHGENSQAYTKAEIPQLDAYIRQLEMKVAACSGAPSPHRFIGTIPTDGRRGR